MAERWAYGDAGDRYRIQLGDIWRVGPHVLSCGDIEAGDHAKLIGLFPPAMAYMDLPYDQANLTLFRKKAGLTKGRIFSEFLASVVRPLSAVTGDVYIEVGNKAAPWVVGALEWEGARVLDMWPIFYYRVKPCSLLRATFGTAIRLDASPKGMDDADTPGWAIAHSSEVGDVVGDFCVGQGLTAVSAARLGRTFLGMELNPRRLAVTLDKLVRMGAGEAVRQNRG